MPEQVPEQVKAQRSDELFAMERRHSREFRRAYIGNEAEVLLEERIDVAGDAYIIGHTRDYVKVAVKLREESPAASEARGVLIPNTVIKVPVRDFLTDDILM